MADDLPLEQLLLALSQTLARSSISHILLELPSQSDFSQIEALTELHRELERGMQLLAGSIPSLRHIVFDIEGKGLKAWEVADIEIAKWRPITECDARQIVSLEGMIWSGRDD
ncbi:hypothetical protein DICSQDRAFT_134137 [Dichomitus squalens LYAD-421 SS1]|uniref:Uncharacterized protein n=1 Tax=Dichomitus squalens TaxID=114155 RepID=A0A4Q9PBH9_9APHY|nr:uncharacterized protein DICSQDRAFT_134137 [Dichomitus squalens LYAD-421 SS1]EJF63585.1 hypothetical protein DICSQDRAFT_134137 [Dichomitus squalens LYAD-421 SS1]TBU51335.1 hypothetical protein BD310DRAFT_953314 [Dichomitus squalens]